MAGVLVFFITGSGKREIPEETVTTKGDHIQGVLGKQGAIIIPLYCQSVWSLDARDLLRFIEDEIINLFMCSTSFLSIFSTVCVCDFCPSVRPRPLRMLSVVTGTTCALNITCSAQEGDIRPTSANHELLARFNTSSSRIVQRRI